MCHNEVMFTGSPIARFPGFEADEGEALGEKGRVKNDEGSIERVEATSRPELSDAVPDHGTKSGSGPEKRRIGS